MDIIPEHKDTVSDMLSDWVQAEKAVLWDCRADGMRTQLQARGMNEEELEALLLHLAASVHFKRTSTRCGAIIIENGMVRPLYTMLNDPRWDIPIPTEPQKALSDRLRELYAEWALQ